MLFGLEPADEPEKDRFLPGRLPGLLPAGTYRFANAPHDPRLAALAFALGAYRFTRYRKARGERRAAGAARGRRRRGALAHRRRRVARARPHQHAGQRHGARGAGGGRARARRAARRERSARSSATICWQNFPLIHAVGRASPRAPRLIDLTWGEPAHPKVTLVGKGVCFDTGGLDIKPDAGMLIMKKDMGGAATALALAHMVMAAKLKVRLRVLIPAVENAISGDAFRPGDVYQSRKGITVEIGNTDAEGRLVLADALALADEETPELIVDIATLTGAARVALGPDLPPFYTDDDALAAELARHARSRAAIRSGACRCGGRTRRCSTPRSPTSTTSAAASPARSPPRCSCAASSPPRRPGLHFDIYGWTPAPKPGRPEGGECQAARALYALLAARYG